MQGTPTGRHPPNGPTPASAVPNLEVTGTAISDGGLSAASTARHLLGANRSPSSTSRAKAGGGGHDSSKRVRPTDVYTAAVSEVGQTDHQAKLRALRVRSASPSANQRHQHQQQQQQLQQQQQEGKSGLSMLLPGVLPSLTPSSPASSTPRSPFHRNYGTRPTEREQSTSILSVLDQGLKSSRSRYAGQEGSLVPTKRTASAPDSQSARLAQQELLRREGLGSPTASAAAAAARAASPAGSAAGHATATARAASPAGSSAARAASPAPTAGHATAGTSGAATSGATSSVGGGGGVGSGSPGSPGGAARLRGASPPGGSTRAGMARPPPLKMGLGQLGPEQENLNLLASPTKPPPPSRLLLGHQHEGLRPPGSPGRPLPPRITPHPLIPHTPTHFGDPSSAANSPKVGSPLRTPHRAHHVRASSAPGQQRLGILEQQLDASSPRAEDGPGMSQAGSPPPVPFGAHRLACASKVPASAPSGEMASLNVESSGSSGSSGRARYVRPVFGPTIDPSAHSFTTSRFSPRPPSNEPRSTTSSPPKQLPPALEPVAPRQTRAPSDHATRLNLDSAGSGKPGELLSQASDVGPGQASPYTAKGPDPRNLPPVRTRRRSSRLDSPGEGVNRNSPAFKGGSPMVGAQLQGELQAHAGSIPTFQDTPGLLSRAQSIASAGSHMSELSSPAPTPGSSNRPGSGRNRAVHFLVDAVRSKDPSRFHDALEQLRLPNGSVAGLNERHAVTGRTPLHEAVMLNNEGVVQRLLEAGAQPNISHPTQGPPLLHAAAWGEADMVELLLGAGADVGAKDIAGHTALHYACSGGHVGAAQSLLRRGADVNIPNEDGETPLVLASHHPSLLSFLHTSSPRTAQAAGIAARSNASTTSSPAKLGQPNVALSAPIQPHLHANSTGTLQSGNPSVSAGVLSGAPPSASTGALTTGPAGPGSAGVLNGLPLPIGSAGVLTQPLVPSPPQTSRHGSAREKRGSETRAGVEARMGATPVPRGYKMQVVQGTGEPQDHHHQHHHHHQSNQHHQQQQQQQQQQGGSGLALQPPGYSSMSTRNLSRRPSLIRQLSLPVGSTHNSSTPSSGTPMHPSSRDAASERGLGSGSEGSPDLLSSPAMRNTAAHPVPNQTKQLRPSPRNGGVHIPTTGSNSSSRSPLQSPLSHDGEEKNTGSGRMPSPPRLELPRSVRKQLSKGAQLQDIIQAFEDEDEEVVRRFSTLSDDTDEDDDKHHSRPHHPPKPSTTPPKPAPIQIQKSPSAPLVPPPPILFGFPPTPVRAALPTRHSAAHTTTTTTEPQLQPHASAHTPHTPPLHHTADITLRPAPSAPPAALEGSTAATAATASSGSATPCTCPGSPPATAAAYAGASASMGANAGTATAPTSAAGAGAGAGVSASMGAEHGPLPRSASRVRDALAAALPRTPRFRFGVPLSITPNSPPILPEEYAWQDRLLAGLGWGERGDSHGGAHGGDQGGSACAELSHPDARKGNAGEPGPDLDSRNGSTGGQAGGAQHAHNQLGEGGMVAANRDKEMPRVSALREAEGAQTEGDAMEVSGGSAIGPTIPAAAGVGVGAEDLQPEGVPSGEQAAGGSDAASRRANLSDSGDIGPPLVSDSSPVSTPRGGPTSRRRPMHMAHMNDAVPGKPNYPSPLQRASSLTGGREDPRGAAHGDHKTASAPGPQTTPASGAQGTQATKHAHNGSSSSNSSTGAQRGNHNSDGAHNDDGHTCSGGGLPPRRGGKATSGQCMAARRIAAAASAAAAQWAKESQHAQTKEGPTTEEKGALYASGGVPPLRISQAAQAMVAQVERASAAARSSSSSGSGMGENHSGCNSSNNHISNNHTSNNHSSNNNAAGAAGNNNAAVPTVGHTSHEALQLRAVAMFTRSMDVQTGSMQWTRGELLGEGSFGRVYAGLNQRTGELMAVKVLELVTKQKAGIQSTIMMHQLQELQQELELYKNLQHLHVVTYIDHHFDARCSTLYIFLEYVPGGSIASMLDRFGKFSEDLVRNYTRQLLLGLEYLHSRRVCHRDLKGGNVLVTRDGVVKLADFGASKAFRGDTLNDGMKSIKGSAFWLAPEVIKGTGYNFKADIWSLGCTVIEMLTGKHPWPELENALTALFQIAKTTQGPPRPHNASPAALDFLDCCLRVDPQERPNASQLLQHPWIKGSKTM